MRWLAFSICVCASGGMRTLGVEPMDPESRNDETGRFGNLKGHGWCGYVSHPVVSGFVTPCTVDHRAPLSRGLLQARTLEWVAIPFSRGSSWPRDRTLVSCMAGRLFTVWAPRKAQKAILLHTENLQVQNEKANPEKMTFMHKGVFILN